MSKTIFAMNYKGVREITLEPTGSLVVIAGANGAGKSSLIDAMTELFAPKGARLTPKPIREGESEAYAEYTDTELGVRVTRTWKKNDAGKLEVYSLDGAKYSKPAEFVAELTGGLLWDPVAFLNLPEKAQRDALLAKVDLPFDIDEIARSKKGAEDRRLEVGREVKRLQGALASVPEPNADTPDVEVSASDLIAELRAAEEHNHQARNAREMAVSTRRTIEDLESRLTAAREALVTLEEAASAEQIDVIGIRTRLDAIDETNKAVRARAEWARLSDELAAAEVRHDAEQAALDGIEERKRAGLAEAVFPVDGLSVDESGVVLDGVPFTQVNSAARRKVAFAIATAGDPKLKLVIIRDGDLLDADSLAAIQSLADERGYTVLIERDRDESRQIGFTIQDGELVE